MRNAVIYARYSSDKQDEASIEAQARACRHRLYADGQASDLACGDTLESMPLATSEHSAHFVFGNNINVKSPFGNSETCSIVSARSGVVSEPV